ncbi:MAG: hypothetical protein J7J51_05245 [Candidatus Omnitrophica bacterium]|nr:hypothetical protein [Candidatus Omnitrophota bacterium]
MAVRELFKIKRITSGDLTMTPTEEAFMIKDIKVINPASDTDYVKVRIKQTYMNVIPVYLLGPVIFGGKHKNMFDYLREKVPDVPNYKILNGEEFAIEPSGTYDYLEVIYSEHDPGDFRAGEPGTRTSEVKLYVNTLYYSGTISASGWYKFDARLEPEITPDYPHFDRIPAGKQVMIIGMAVYSKAEGSTVAKYLRVWDEEKVLFDDDRNGFLIDPTVFNEISTYESITTGGGTQKPVGFFRFEEPFVMGAQRKYQFEFYVDYDGTNALQPKDVMLTLLGLELPSR